MHFDFQDPEVEKFRVLLVLILHLFEPWAKECFVYVPSWISLVLSLVPLGCQGLSLVGDGVRQCRPHLLVGTSWKSNCIYRFQNDCILLNLNATLMKGIHNWFRGFYCSVIVLMFWKHLQNQCYTKILTLFDSHINPVK